MALDLVKMALRYECEQPSWPRRLVRRKDFFLGRYCAKVACENLGVKGGIVKDQGLHQAPLWPEGLVGSITHTLGYAAAAVGSMNHYASIGIDSERCMSDEVADHIKTEICNGQELRLVSKLAHQCSASQLYTLIFSTKESIYKCLHPMSRIDLEFNDIEVTHIDLSGGQVFARLRKSAGLRTHAEQALVGRLLIDEGLVHTNFILSADHHWLDPARMSTDRYLFTEEGS